MDDRFLIHNTHLRSIADFKKHDPQLSSLAQQVYQYHDPLLQKLPLNEPGIYTICGGRQIGKTTLLKQWMLLLLESGVPANLITFFTGDAITDDRDLVTVLMAHIQSLPVGHRYLLIDEVTYIVNWDKGIKFMADGGLFRDTTVILTGSESTIIQEARMRFPGRRGKADYVDFHLHPLSFNEFFFLKHSDSPLLNKLDDFTCYDTESVTLLYQEFSNYLIHGGYLTAINEMALSGKISRATLNTYAEWIRGDILRRGKMESSLKEIIQAIISSYNSQVSYNSLAQIMTIEHPQTVADYITLLSAMDAVFIQHALREDKLCAAPKKAKKIWFRDPFIFHALTEWLSPTADPFGTQIMPLIENPLEVSKLVENIAVTHCARFYDTYYIKAEGEVDIAYIDNKQFWPIEIKWTNQLRPKSLKQIAKYPNSRIWTKFATPGDINNIPTIPLPIALLQLTSPLAFLLQGC